MDFHKLVAERVIIFEHSADPHWRDFEEVSLQYRVAVREAVCALPGIRLCDFVLDNGVEDNALLGVFDQIDEFTVANIFSNECLVLELGLEILKSALAHITDVLYLPEPPERHLANHVVSTLFWVVLLDVVGCSSQQAYVLRGNHPSVDLRVPGDLCAISICFQALLYFNFRARNEGFPDLGQRVIVKELFQSIGRQQFALRL